MHRQIPFPAMLLALFLFSWTSFSPHAADEVRKTAVATLAPVWHLGDGLKRYLSDRPLRSSERRSGGSFEEKASLLQKIGTLELENRALRSELEFSKEWLSHDKNLEHTDRTFQSTLSQARRTYFSDLLLRQLQAIPGKVIYRDPSSWASSLWIDVGSDDNQVLGFPVVSRNSPVVEGNTLIGVIDYVGRRQSRVRLITNSGVAPAVRVARGNCWYRDVVDLLDALSFRFIGKGELLELLEKLKGAIARPAEDAWLAKGHLQGSKGSFWSARPILKGTGFNYDYSDEEGPARDLRTGRPIKGSQVPTALIQEGDLLITSGLDGVFPPGLAVAVVSFVAPLQEGAFAYDIEAVPAAHNLQQLQTVFVLPSLSGEE